jgi:DNA-binding NarL/FixJ family response regulator
MTHEEIAAERGSSPTTIKSHVHQLLRKTGDRSMLAAVARLLRERG